MVAISFADVVHQSVSFSKEIESQLLILELIDSPWVQRLRDLSQTANTRLVYMFSEHSRFGHSLGVAYLAERLIERLSQNPDYSSQIAPYRCAIAAAAILHDIGHIAPGCHTAYKTWFPKSKDVHEGLTAKIIKSDKQLHEILEKYDSGLSESVCNILLESDAVPPWTWEIISGGGWNVDRGNWCIVDSILAGVSYGQYNIPALTESIVITKDGHLALKENRLDSMMHFSVSRHAMYRQLYQHRVLLAADMLNKAIAQRARDLGSKIGFCDETMRAALEASSPEELSVETIYQMREPWWRYHLTRWCTDGDPILGDLSNRLVNRKLLKTVRLLDGAAESELLSAANRAVREAGFDPRYYLHEISTLDMHASDLEQSMPVLMDDGTIKKLTDADPLFKTLLIESKQNQRRWLALPQEAKERLGVLR